MAPYVYIIAIALSLLTIRLVARERSDFRIWAMYVLAFVLFAHLRTLADETGIPARFGYPVAIEKLLFAGSVPSIWLQERLYEFGRTSALDTYAIAVYASYFFAPHAFAFILWLRQPERLRPYLMAVLLTVYLGLAISYIVPTAPPWLAGQVGTVPHVFRVMEDITTQFSASAYQQGYSVAGTNPVAAMPSLHMAVTFVIAFSAWRLGPIPGILSVLYAASMGFALVYLGEHYVVDLLAGLATAFIAWKLAAVWLQDRGTGKDRPPER